jgi:hypothetical protein
MNKAVKLNDALRILDESLLPDGSQKPFSIEFYKYSKTKKDYNGELVKMDNVVKCGLPFNVKDAMMRGLRNPRTNQVRSCYIWLINKINGVKVKW